MWASRQPGKTRTSKAKWAEVYLVCSLKTEPDDVGKVSPPICHRLFQQCSTTDEADGKRMLTSSITQL